MDITTEEKSMVRENVVERNSTTEKKTTTEKTVIENKNTTTENTKWLTNSQMNEKLATSILLRLEDGTKNSVNNEVKITLGRKNHKKEYRLPKQNAEDALSYVKHLITNCCIKITSIGVVISVLIYLGDFLRKPFKQVEKEDLQKFFLKYSYHEDGRPYADSYRILLKRVLKPFFRWVHQTKDYPPVVDWFSTCIKVKDRKMPEILTMEDIKQMLEVCDNMRDRALISVLFESGIRVGELLNLKIKDVSIDKYGCILNVFGKTGQRKVRLVSAVTDLKQWLNQHSFKDRPEMMLFTTLSKSGKNKGRPLVNSSVNFLLKEISKKAGITKKCNPHAFRHAAASNLATQLPEHILKQYFGWTQGSRMASVYVNFNGKESNEAILKMHGLLSKEGKPMVVPTIKCWKCNETNSAGNRWCLKCLSPLDEKTKEEELKMIFLRKMLPHITEMLKSRDIKQEDLDEFVQMTSSDEKNEGGEPK